MDVWQGKKAGTLDEQKIMKAFETANIHPVGLLHTGEYEMTQLRTFWDSYMRGSFKNELQHTLDTIKKPRLERRLGSRQDPAEIRPPV